MEGLLQQVASIPLNFKLAAAVLGILAIHAASRLLEETLPHHFVQADARYRVRKFVIFAGYVVAILFLVILFEDRLGRLSLALGVVGCRFGSGPAGCDREFRRLVRDRILEAIRRGRQDPDWRNKRRCGRYLDHAHNRNGNRKLGQRRFA
jgi:hypothetical protein